MQKRAFESRGCGDDRDSTMQSKREWLAVVYWRNWRKSPLKRLQHTRIGDRQHPDEMTGSINGVAKSPTHVSGSCPY